MQSQLAVRETVKYFVEVKILLLNISLTFWTIWLELELLSIISCRVMKLELFYYGTYYITAG